MQYKPLLVNAEDLQALVGVEPERKRREYKEILPPSKGDDHKEFISDVSSFANSVGGDLIYGVKEDRATGMAGEIVGIPTAEVETNIARIENIVRDNIGPRLPHFAMHTVEVAAGRTVLVLRIGESHLAPHQNKLNHRFFARNTNGKYILEASELREIILRRQSLPEQMREFRRERIELIRNRPEDMPLTIEPAKKLILHFLPLETFGTVGQVNASEFATNRVARNSVLEKTPVHATNIGLSNRPNIDGYVFMSGTGDRKFPFYVQVFNDGSVEFVDSTAFASWRDEPVFGSGQVETNLFYCYEFVRGIFEVLRVGGPIHVFMSFLGMRDHTLVLPNQFIPRDLEMVGHSTTIGRDPALFTEVIVDDMQQDPKAALYPVVAQFWRAAAYDKPLSYNDAGQYTGV